MSKTFHFKRAFKNDSAMSHNENSKNQRGDNTCQHIDSVVMCC